MEKLSMCRICLIKDVRLHFIVNTHLQEIYEFLSGNLLETKDTRPLHACYMCCARLRNCLRLRTACLHSEELFSHLLENDSWEVTPPQSMNMLQITPVININMDPVVDRKLKIDPSPMRDEQRNDEHVGDLQDDKDKGICTQFIKQENIKSENVSSEDEDLDYSIQSIKVESNLDNSCLQNGTLESYVSKSNLSISAVDLQDVYSKSDKIVSHQMDLNTFRKDLRDNIIDKGICTQFIKQQNIKSENVSSEDEDLDYSTKSIEVEINSTSDNSSLENSALESYVSESNPGISSVYLQDMYVSHRINFNSFQKGKSRAEYMRNYRQKKREEKLRTSGVQPKKMARSSTERSREWRARVAGKLPKLN